MPQRITSCSNSSAPGRLSHRHGGFTLVELLVVVAIISVLIVSLITVGRGMLTKTKIQSTKAVMQQIDMALDQFRNDAPLKRNVNFRNRYANFPSDELKVFLPAPRVPRAEAVRINPGRNSELHLPPRGLSGIRAADVKAMALTIRLFSPEASAILDKIDPQYRETADDPAEFYDRDNSDGGTAGPQDVSLTYFVDAWGNPFSYFAALESDPTDPRVRLSTFFHGANRGRALLVSSGPNGSAALDEGIDLVIDFNDETPGVIDNPLNEDNIYLDDTLRDRLRNPPESN